ncbi:DUF3859 domain-containing protein [Maridesulfovibrio sp. FT414]|uniref:DUF3859 domain-containing protein n=1 Tax=Maridesulfovibrio sp. FT414 TaxID=2979469 RepID=UPI003D80333E
MRCFARTIALVTMLLVIALLAPSVSPAEPIKILGRGLYQLIPTDSSTLNKQVMQLKEYALLEETEEVEAIMGASFGFEFYLEGNEPATTMLRITHPRLPSPSGIGFTTIHTFPVLLKPGEKYFAGWNFSESYELQPGKWKFELDFPEKVGCEFTVVPVEDLVYDGSRLKAPEVLRHESGLPPESTAPESLPAGEILTRYLVRGGIYPSLNEAEEGAKTVKSRGYEPFIFVREKPGRQFWYYLFIKMFDSEQEATDFATGYRQKYRRKAVSQKVQINLAPR